MKSIVYLESKMANQPRIYVPKKKHNTFHYTIILSTCKKLMYRSCLEEIWKALCNGDEPHNKVYIQVIQLI
jgi:hypothetical protein